MKISRKEFFSGPNILCYIRAVSYTHLGNHITQKQLAKKIGVSASQLSRIVSGETKTVSSDILIGVAKEFKVSTDYILGLSTLSVRKSYDISELGLSEGAVRGLVAGTVDVQILNRLLEHRNFPKLMDLIRIYFQDTAATVSYTHLLDAESLLWP